MKLSVIVVSGLLIMMLASAVAIVVVLIKQEMFERFTISPEVVIAFFGNIIQIAIMIGGFALTIVLLIMQMEKQNKISTDLQEKGLKHEVGLKVYELMSADVETAKTEIVEMQRRSIQMAVVSDFFLDQLLSATWTPIIMSQPAVDEGVRAVINRLEDYEVVAEELVPLKEDMISFHERSEVSFSRLRQIGEMEDVDYVRLSAEAREYTNVSQNLFRLLIKLEEVAQNRLIGTLFERHVTKLASDQRASAQDQARAFVLGTFKRLLPSAIASERNEFLSGTLNGFHGHPGIALELLQEIGLLPRPEAVFDLGALASRDDSYVFYVTEAYKLFARLGSATYQREVTEHLLDQPPTPTGQEADGLLTIWLEAHGPERNSMITSAIREGGDQTRESRLQNQLLRAKEESAGPLALRVTAEDALISAGAQAVWTVEVSNESDQIQRIRLLSRVEGADELFDVDDITIDTVAFPQATVMMTGEQESRVDLGEVQPTGGFVEAFTLRVVTPSRSAFVCNQTVAEGTQIQARGCVVANVGLEPEFQFDAGYVDSGGSFKPWSGPFRMARSPVVYRIFLLNPSVYTLTNVLIEVKLEGSHPLVIAGLRMGFPSIGRATIPEAHVLQWRITALDGPAELQFETETVSPGLGKTEAELTADQTMGSIRAEHELRVAP